MYGNLNSYIPYCVEMQLMVFFYCLIPLVKNHEALKTLNIIYTLLDLARLPCLIMLVYSHD